MTVTMTTLEEATDLIQAATITRHDEHPASVRLDLDHPSLGVFTTIQVGNEVYVIRHADAGALAR